jgi:transposase
LIVDIIQTSCAGLDVHKMSVTVCVMRLVHGELIRETRRFGTMTSDLLALSDWLAELEVRQVAMESTGVYWKPIFQVLEDQCTVILVNAQHIKRVPGRKTDVSDAEWIADLLLHGLLSPSFIPPKPIRELRDLTRSRTLLIRERATVANRIQKVLEDANIKLAGVASDILGASGQDMIGALIRGRTDPVELADLARERLRKKIPELQQALHGRVTEHHRFLLRSLMDQVRHLDGQIGRFDGRIAKLMAPFHEAAQRLRTIPGIGQASAEVIVAEIGVDMSRFPTSGHLASWAGMCPGNDQSAGKRRSGRTTKGSQYLRSTLVQVAWAATHTKATHFRALYARWAKRMGKKKALVALGHKIVVIIHKLLSVGTAYREPPSAPRAA